MLLKELTVEQKNCISSEIQFNIKAEAEANEFYFKLLNNVADEDKETIKGIIADELNHAIILGKLQEKYSGILPSEFTPLLFVKRKENNYD
jgi:rubrerythrin